MKHFACIFELECDSQEEAEIVLSERLGPDEDYGFTYRIMGWSAEEVGSDGTV